MIQKAYQAMRLPRVRLTVRRIMGVVAVVALSLAFADWVVMSERAAKYRRRVEWYEGQLRRCKQIDAMDAQTRASEADVTWNWDYLYVSDPELNRRMITYFSVMKKKYEFAAEHPRIPVTPDPIPR